MLPKRLQAVGVFTIVYLVAAIVLAAMRMNKEFIFYIVTMFVELALVLMLDRRVKFPRMVLWGLSTWGLIHMCGGLVHIPAAWAEPGTSGVLYNLRVFPWAPKFDQFVHAYGFGVATLAAWHCLHVGSRGIMKPTAGPLAAAGLIGMGLGAINEAVEFAATLLFPGTNVGGYQNTGWDLVSNLVGCLIALAIIRAGRPGADTIKA